MHKSFKRIIAAVVSAAVMAGIASVPVSAETPEKEYMNVGYAFRRGLVIEELDLSTITHLNYSFGLIYNRETPPDPDAELNPDCQTPTEFDDSLLNTIYLPDDAKSDLKKLPALKAEKNPDLKVMLSVGGWNARGFSDAASTEEGRKAFADSCKEVIDEYDLDGIDLDWEYPTIDWANIKTRPEDPQNFTLLLQEVRKAIGNDKLLSIAGSANVNFSKEWVEFDKVIEILDYINIMTYDFQYGTCYYGSALYASKKWPTTYDYDEYNADFGIQKYIEAGCPAEKINMGLAFGANYLPGGLIVTDEDKANWDLVKQNLKDSGFLDSKEPTLKRIPMFLENKEYTREDGSTFKFDKKWDEDACVSYIATYNDKGEELFVMAYIDALGVTAKTDYVKKHNLGGTMFWEFGSDYDNLLTNQLAKELNLKKDSAPVTTAPVETAPETTEPVENPTTGNAAPVSAAVCFAAPSQQ